jgi:tungstate transport system substrate-binding protein
MNAYILSDRGTWLAFKNRGDLEISVEGDEKLFNQYGVMLVNPTKHPHVKKVEGEKFIQWLILKKVKKLLPPTKLVGTTFLPERKVRFNRW